MTVAELGWFAAGFHGKDFLPRFWTWAVGLGFASWQTVFVLPLLGLDALVWGLLGGALCRRVLTAVLTGIAFMVCTWMWLPLWNSNLTIALGKTAAALVGGYFSWRQFAGVDRSRWLATEQVSSKGWSLFPASGRVLLWLAFRRGRWLLAAGLGGALVLGGAVNGAPLLLWPLGTLLLGLTFGLSAFPPDRGAGARFLGVHRFPPGRIWTAEPFDVKEFAASLPPVEKNEAGPLIRRAGAEMWEYRDKIEPQFWLPIQPPQPSIPQPTAPHYGIALHEIVEKGWPREDKALGRWLDKLFEGEWVQDAQKAAQLPLGLVEDPRLLEVYTPQTNIYQQSRVLAQLFTARALQLQARGDARGALSHLETVLALSRQIRNYAPFVLMTDGCEMEDIAISGFRLWLQKLGPDKELLRTALAILQRHEAAIPDPANTIEAEYLIYRNSTFPRNPNREKPPVDDLLSLVSQVPWEKERQRRIARALVSSLLRGIQQPLWKTRGWGQPRNANTDPAVREAARVGLPPENGPGSRLSARQWGGLLFQFDIYNYAMHHHPGNSTFTHPLAARSQQRLHVAQLVTALARYQADHGGPPDQLGALMPAYLAALPDDPFSGEPFGYRISMGEKNGMGDQALLLAPGQAVVWSEYSPSVVFPVPTWAK